MADRDALARVVAQLAQVRELMTSSYDELRTMVPPTLGEAYTIQAAANALGMAAHNVAAGLEMIAQLLAQRIEEASDNAGN